MEMLSENLLKLVEEIEVLESKLDAFNDLKQANIELDNENSYMRDLLTQLGIDDIWGDFTVNSLSVADVMAIEKALLNVWAVR